mmetsp:Transcript_1089/g.1714  ORF Transcript_1089/g.1714 Transcript_1089/m.1714 type:complete len:831 (+) Transcript_1089:2296-4788(+)
MEQVRLDLAQKFFNGGSSQDIASEWIVFLLSCLQEIPSQPIRAPEFRFDGSREAAEHNATILAMHGYNLNSAIRSQHGTPLDPGSEFKPVSILDWLCTPHPLWRILRGYLSQGVSYPMLPLSEQDRCNSLRHALARGNHSSIDHHTDIVHQAVQDDVLRGYILPLQRAAIESLQEAEVAPIGVVEQTTINEHGQIIPKFRSIHDQSFPPAFGPSINDRVLLDLLPPCKYGHTLHRIIHAIIALRLRDPQARILISKIDLDKAYRRLHSAPSLSARSCFIFDDFANVYLRLSFGNSGHPSGFSTLSELICDYANILLNAPSWDTSILCARSVSVIPSPKLDPSPTAPHQALPLCVAPSIGPFGTVQVFLDDFISVVSDTKDNARRVAFAVPVTIEAMSCPLLPSEPIPRTGLISTKKLQAEGQPSEIQTVLGWVVNTRSLTIALPRAKYIAWCHEIDNTLNKKRIGYRNLASLVGKLNHAGSIVPFAQFFLSRLHHLKRVAEQSGAGILSPLARQDLKFWKVLLLHASRGMSLNLLSLREPDRGYKGDACPFGLGGHSLHGRAWRWKIPLHLLGRASINLLELLASVVGPWIDFLEGNLPEYSCCLCEGDNTSAMAWLASSNFDEIERPAHHEAARKIAEVMMAAKACVHPHWIPGASNDIADILSRDFDIPDDVLTHLIPLLFPDQTPRSFKIAPLPKEIDLWLTSLLQSLPEPTQSLTEHARSKVLRGLIGNFSVKKLDWDLIYFLIQSTSHTTAHSSSWHTPMQSTVSASVKENWMATFSAAVSKMPSQLFQRPSDYMAGPIPALMKMDALHSFYNVSGVPTVMSTAM